MTINEVGCLIHLTSPCNSEQYAAKYPNQTVEGPRTAFSCHLSTCAEHHYEGYINIEKNTLNKIRIALLLPAATVTSLVIFRQINKEQAELLRLVKSHTIADDEEYNKLLELYKDMEKLVKASNSTATIAPDDYDRIYKSVPFLLKPIINQVFQFIKTSLALYKALGEKLYLRPKNVTDEQLKAAAVDGLEDWFDDDDDYADYAKKLSLRNSGHQQ